MSHLRVMLDYLHPWPNAAGFFVARERGWYAEAGLDVELTVHDAARGDTLAHLLRSEVDFGVFPSNRLLVRRERAEPLVGVAAVNNGGLETIQARRAAGIRRPRDLAGRRVGFAPTPRGKAMVAHLVAADGGDPSAVVTVDTGTEELTPELLLGSDLDAVFGGYYAWDCLGATDTSAEVLTWRVGDIGAPDYHSYLLGTQSWTLERAPVLVSAFLDATARGFAEAALEREETTALLARQLPYLARWRLARSLELVAPTWTAQGRWGVQREELLAPYARFLVAYGILEDEQVWREAVTNEFLPR